MYSCSPELYDRIKLAGQLLHLPLPVNDAALCRQVDAKEEIAAGSEEEVELRAASIHAVELLRQAVQEQQLLKLPKEEGHGGGQADAVQQQQQLLSIHLDWWLWEEGERMRKQHPPHHRTWTIYY
jgi:hypothetical protein